MMARRVERTPEVIVVGSGKGGVGKSVLSVMLGTVLAAEGHRVLLFDADHNLGNLHVLLGVRPRARMDALLGGDVEPADMVQPIGDGLWLLPGDSGDEALQSLESLDRARLHQRLSALYDAYDVVIVDAGAGIESVVRVGTMRATRLVVVTMPEPTALTDAYALMKIVNLQLPELPMDLLVNRCLTDEEGRAAYEKIATACERFLRRGVRHLASVGEDDAVRAAVRDPRRLLALLSASAASLTLRQAARERLSLPAPMPTAV